MICIRYTASQQNGCKFYTIVLSFNGSSTEIIMMYASVILALYSTYSVLVSRLSTLRKSRQNLVTAGPIDQLSNIKIEQRKSDLRLQMVNICNVRMTNDNKKRLH